MGASWNDFEKAREPCGVGNYCYGRSWHELLRVNMYRKNMADPGEVDDLEQFADVKAAIKRVSGKQQNGRQFSSKDWQGVTCL